MRLRHVLLAATLLIGGTGITVAETAANTTALFDPAQLPAIQGKVAEYSLTPRGDVDGLILTDGTEVHLPPHLGTQLVFAVKPGDAVTIRGLRARAIPMVRAMSVTNDASGATVVDTSPGGPRGPRGQQQALTAQGKIKAQLHGPQGELNGVLLEDGTLVRLPPPEATRLASQLAVGSSIYVQGQGFAGSVGRVVMARAIGPDANQLTQIEGPRWHMFGHRGPGGPGGPGGRGGPDMAPPGGPGAPPPPPPG